MSQLVLIVEDELKIRELVRRYLEREGLEVLTTGSGAEAITMAADARPDLVVLDLGLPDVPGEEVARELRAQVRRADPDADRALGRARPDRRARARRRRLRDQAVQPARADAARAGGAAPPRRVRRPHGPVSYGGGVLRIDEERHEVSVRGSRVELTPTEWGLLTALARTPGRVYSRYELINRVRGYEFEGYERTVDSHVKNLRRKIEADAQRPEIVQTVLGVGYRLGLRADG